MPNERTTKVEGGVSFVTHRLRRHEKLMGGLNVTFPIALPESEAAFTVTDPAANKVTLYVETKFKKDFIAGLRAALDEWEKS